MTDPLNDGAVTPTTLSIPVRDFVDAGLEEEWMSWLGSGPNELVTAEQITQTVGEEELARVTEHFGIRPDDLAVGIAEALPRLIDGARTIPLQVALNNVPLSATPQMVVGEEESNVSYRAPLRISMVGPTLAPGDYTGSVTMVIEPVPPK
ncbi:YidB family protein [Streptomyces virginiae]|uniref:YidB family protein n=1 Tax=Streptomyces virginiae TaxID=1961 RepID=UPI0037927D77